MKKPRKNDEIEIIEEEAETMKREKGDTISKLKADLKKCIGERREYLDGWQRMKADMVNTNRGLEEKNREFMLFAKEEFFVEFFPVIDSFELAFRDKDVWERVDENWRKGVEYIYEQFKSILKTNGFDEIDPQDEPFDPQHHVSVESIEVDSKEEDGLILEVVRMGYMFEGKIVRPAQVKVKVYKK